MESQWEKKENEENQLLQFVHQEGLHLVYEGKIPRHKWKIDTYLVSPPFLQMIFHKNQRAEDKNKWGEKGIWQPDNFR